ncbi:hypothetical protein ORI99_00100 [Alishewanella sp. SMS9]|nr:hypothetical protein [Alishewanella sp. SMS9]
MSYVEDNDRHNLYLQRLASGLLRTNVYPTLEAAYKAARLIMLDHGEIKNLRQLNAVLKKVDASTVKITSAGLDEVTKELQAIAIYEASYYAALVGGYAGATLTVPGNKTIKDFIDTALMSLTSGQRVTAGLWGEFIGNQIASTAVTYNNAIKASFVNNESVSQAVARMRQATQGLLRREYETLTRTGLQHYAIQAREAMAADNLDILERRYYNSVFDNRRTLICAGNHGKTWLLTDESYIRLPAHHGCRSSWLFLLKGQKAPDGTMAAIGGKDTERAKEKYENRSERTDKKIKYRGKKDADMFNPGQISAKTGVDSWLRSQPGWFVQDTLGNKKAKLFLDGKLPISSFTDATGRTLTLKELAVRDAAAFERAGLPKP